MRPMVCDVYFKDEGVFIVCMTVDQADASRRFWREPLLKLDPEPTSSALGRAVRQALDQSQSPVPKGLVFDIDMALRAVGVRGWSGLQASSRLVSVEDDGSQVKLRPRRRLDSDPGLAELASGRDPEEIGRVLREMRPSCPLSDPLSSARPGRSYLRRSPRPPMDGGIPSPFGYKTDWLVVDSTDAGAVASALGLERVRPATWDIDPYNPEGVFVSPSILGWTFVLGLRLGSTGMDSPEFADRIETLSRKFGEVQYFATHRVVGLAAWVRAVGGRIERGYGWVGDRGEVQMDVGPLTAEEEELGFARLINRKSVEGSWDDLVIPGEEDVMMVAGKWSINPQELDAHDSEGPGFVGREP